MFGNLNKMKITPLEPKDYYGRPGKGLITSLVLKDIRRSKNVKKEKFAIYEVSIKDFSKIIKECKDFFNESYVRKRFKHVLTDSYFYLEINIAKFITSTQKMCNSHGLVRAQKMSNSRRSVRTKNMSA